MGKIYGNAVKFFYTALIFLNLAFFGCGSSIESILETGYPFIKNVEHAEERIDGVLCHFIVVTGVENESWGDRFFRVWYLTEYSEVDKSGKTNYAVYVKPYRIQYYSFDYNLVLLKEDFDLDGKWDLIIRFEGTKKIVEKDTREKEKP
jgi:hypothetical protein